MKYIMLAAAVLAVAPSVIVIQAAPPAGPAPTVTYNDAPNFTLVTDWTADEVLEVQIRLNCVRNAFLDFAQKHDLRLEPDKDKTKALCLLFRNQQTYLKAGGPKLPWAWGGQWDAKGVYVLAPTNNVQIMNLPEQVAIDTAMTMLQGMTFQRYLDTTPFKQAPAWITAGLSHYYGNGAWAGTRIVTGRFSNTDQTEVDKALNSGKFVPFAKFFAVDNATWNKLPLADRQLGDSEAWSIVYYLMHGDNGKHKDAFDGFITDVAGGTGWQIAWSKRFKENVQVVEKNYRDWCKDKGDVWGQKTVLDTAVNLELLATAAALAQANGQKFDNLESLMQAIADGKLTFKKEWGYSLPMPPVASAAKYLKSLVTMEKVDGGGLKFTYTSKFFIRIDGQKKKAVVTATTHDGTPPTVQIQTACVPWQ